MRRREFLGVLGGAAAAWTMSARAQQLAQPMRRIGVLMNLDEGDRQGQARLAAFLEGLQQSGWSNGRNLHIEIRWGAGDVDRFRLYAAELVALSPEVILAGSGATMPALLQATRSIPIVFTQVPDPVGAGFVASLARPGGNVTGFLTFEYSLSAKWLELLKQIAPPVTRAAVLRDTADPAGLGQWGAIQTAASSFGVELTAIGLHDATEIERDVTAFARAPNGGLIVTGSTPTGLHRQLIVSLAARHRLPAVYPYRYFGSIGALVSYGPESLDQYRRAAGYVDRILKGEKPGELPVQAPTRYELVINLKTARALGLEMPATLLARADEVIE
jgi:putative tryptophan/tyrosine transport system substrate-binding protein